jgi:hypothetical protein
MTSSYEEKKSRAKLSAISEKIQKKSFIVVLKACCKRLFPKAPLELLGQRSHIRIVLKSS